MGGPRCLPHVVSSLVSDFPFFRVPENPKSKGRDWAQGEWQVCRPKPLTYMPETQMNSTQFNVTHAKASEGPKRKEFHWKAAPRNQIPLLPKKVLKKSSFSMKNLPKAVKKHIIPKRNTFSENL